MSKSRSMALGMIFLIGCAVGGASSRFFARPAHAAPAPTRWEYNCFSTPFQTTEKANELGAQGWELVAGAGAGGSQSSIPQFLVWCFKRPR